MGPMIRERLTAWIALRLFGHRRIVFTLFVVITIGLGGLATQLGVDADFTKTIPLQHDYMRTFSAYQKTFGGANRIIVALLRKDGRDIFSPDFFQSLKNATDDVYFIPGVERSSVTSLFTPNARFMELTEDGYAGGNLVFADFGGTAEDLQKVRANVLKSGELGRLVSQDLKGALIRAELMEHDPDTGAKLDVFKVSHQLDAIRAKYETAEIGVHIIGFPSRVGEVSAGTRGVLQFFGLAFLITAALLLGFTRSWRLSAVALVVASVPVIWLLGLLHLLGFGIDPMSILLPFLIFSIGISHAVQMTNAWRHRRMLTDSSLAAAEEAFRRLFVPGVLALATNAIAFLVIMLIKIEIVREFGLAACLGVMAMIASNKLLLPVMLSWLSLPTRTLQREQRAESRYEPLWRGCASLSRPRLAYAVLVGASLLLAAGAWQAQDIRIGDLGEGVSELRDTSRYNRDNAAIVRNFSIGVDVLSVIVQTHGMESACTQYAVMDAMDRLERTMRESPEVRSVLSAASVAKQVNSISNEGNPKWRTLPRDAAMLAQDTSRLDTASGLIDANCNAMQILIFTRDHQGATIARLIEKIKRFAAENNSKQMEFKLASGNVGVMAATNEAVAAAENQMLVAIFGALALLCFITFRSLTAVLCILLPLALVTVLCNALMAMLGIGLKLSTLPVMVLGMGVGVDYGIYLYDTMRQRLLHGETLLVAFNTALRERGAATIFTALTMSVGVATWSFSALKFQADMGVLLAFLFLINALAAIVLLPALAGLFIRKRDANG